MEFDKIRKHLVWKYTIVTTIMLISILSISSYLNLHLTYTAIEETLSDYLIEEVHEAKQNLRHSHVSIELVSYINPNTNTLMSLWYSQDKLVHAEVPDDPLIREELIKRIMSGHHSEQTIYKEKINNKWTFLVMSQNIKDANGRTGRVIVISNISKLERNFSYFFHCFSLAVFLLGLLSFFLGNFFAARAIRQINSLMERQKRFVSDASHELRTPLSIMLAYTELLEHKKSPETLRRLKDEITSMADLTGRLLQFARFDNNQISFNPETFDLNTFLKTLIKDISLLAKSKSISIHANFLQNHLLLTADKLLLKHLLYILLDNALKYSPEKSVISLSAGKEKNNVVIEVRDQGIGIAEKDLKHIFERFYRADKARNRNADQGLGLGLSFAWLIAQRHGGKIDVKSTVNHGSTFKVILPPPKNTI